MGGILSFLKHKAWAPFFKIIFELIRREDMNEIIQLDKHCDTCRCELLVGGGNSSPMKENTRERFKINCILLSCLIYK
jgi:hypothetical protein